MKEGDVVIFIMFLAQTIMRRVPLHHAPLLPLRLNAAQRGLSSLGGPTATQNRSERRA